MKEVEKVLSEVFSQHPHWPSVTSVCEVLRKAGFQAWLAGGCVRDLLLQRTPNDFDIATDALPEQVERLFQKSVAIGKAFGVIAVPFDGFLIEIATFRSDGAYVDGRRPEGVEFSSPKLDAERRDFTVNSMFFDLEKNEVIDFVGGKEDLKRKRLVTVGEPKRRFAEDRLRVLRAVRFAAQLEFSIDANTYKELCNSPEKVKAVSSERIRDEMNKLLLAKTPAIGFQLMEFCGLARVLFPQFVEPDQWFEMKLRLERFANNASVAPGALEIAWTLLFFGLWEDHVKTLNESEIEEIEKKSSLFVEENLRDWKFSKEFLKKVTRLFCASEVLKRSQQFRSGEVIKYFGKVDLGLLHEVCFVLGEDTVKKLNGLKLPEALPESFLNGADLKNMGFVPGKVFKEILHLAFCLQLEGSLSSRSAALNWLKKQRVK